MNNPDLDVSLAKRALVGGDDECGDHGLVAAHDGQCFLALIDALGHGREAHEVALLAESFLMEHYREDLVTLMQGLHEHLLGTRGVVAAFCRVSKSNGDLCYVGVGNITTKIFGEKDIRFVPRDGIVGYMMTTPKERRAKLYPGDILMLSSDGIREHFDPHQFPGLFTGSAREIASGVLAKLGRANDDASCMILRYR